MSAAKNKTFETSEENAMKLGIIGNWNNEDFFRFAKSKGLECLEFCMNNGNDSAAILADAANIKERLDRHGLTCCAVGRWGMKRIDDDGNVIPEALAHDKNIISVAAAIGAPVFNCGCNFAKNKTFAENCDIASDYFKGLIEYAKPLGVKIAVYNCSWENDVYDERTWETILSRVPELGLKYDVSHCVNRGGDYLREMAKYGNRIYHFHLKGSIYIDGKRFDDPPIGLDSTNWGAVMNMLYYHNYNGTLSLEPHSPENWTGNKGLWGIEFSINYIKPYIMPEDYATDYPKEFKPW